MRYATQSRIFCHASLQSSQDKHFFGADCMQEGLLERYSFTWSFFMMSFTEKMLKHQKPKSSQPSCSGWMKNNDLKRLNFVSLHTTAEDELKPAHFT
jgi:hypothetical protein